MDSGTEGAERLNRAVDAARLKRERIIQVSDVTGNKHSDIEDMFEISDYLAIFNKALSTSITENDLGAGDRIVKRLEKPFKPGSADGLGGFGLSHRI